MECTSHPGYAAAGACPRCGQPLCADCLAAHQQVPGACPATAPAPRPRPNFTALWILAGVLVLCLTVLLVVAYVTSRAAAPAPASVPAVAPDLGPPPVQSPAATVSRETTALQTALADHYGWQGQVTWHQDDWSEARVSIGPSLSDLRLSRSLWWDQQQQGFRIIAEKPIAAPTSPTAPVGPGQQAAAAAARQQDPGWVVRIIAHSNDWGTVTLWTGPPNSEFVNAYRFHWDTGLAQYVLDHAGTVGESAGGPPAGE